MPRDKTRYDLSRSLQPRRAVALAHGWNAAVLLDLLVRLGRASSDSIEVDGQTWFPCAREDLCRYMGVNRSAYESARSKLEDAEILHTRKVKGVGLYPVNHFSVDLSNIDWGNQ